MNALVTAEAVILVLLFPLNVYFVWHGLRLYRRIPSRLLHAMWVTKLMIAVLSAFMAVAAAAALVFPPRTPVTWLGLLFGLGLIMVELTPAYIHLQMRAIERGRE